MHPTDLGPGIVFFDAEDVRFSEVAPPTLSREIRTAIDDVWDDMVRRVPSLFDGPVVLCNEVREADDELEVRWSRATYRYRTVRQIVGAPALSSMFVCVLQSADDGRLLVGVSSASTTTPGQVGLPGGNLEPPPSGLRLTLSSLRRHAAAELVEETGITVDPDDLAFWAAARVSNGNLGCFFIAPRLPVELIHERHAAVLRAEQVAGREPEFTAIALVDGAPDLAALDAVSADYLQPVIDRFRAGGAASQ